MNQARVRTGWTPRDSDFVRAGNRKHLRRLISRHGSTASIPGFRASIVRLFEQGYSSADISAFLGLSRERVRQLVEEYGIETGPRGSQPRVWDDDRSCFVAISLDEYREIAKAHERSRALCEIVTCLLDAMRAEHERLGVAPGLRGWQRDAPKLGLPAHSSYYKYFGSWPVALWLAGIIDSTTAIGQGSPGHRKGCDCGRGCNPAEGKP